MGYDYYIACKNCKRFVALARWRIFPDLQFPTASTDLFPKAGNVAAARIESSSLRERLTLLDDPFSIQRKEAPEFQKLVAILTEFWTDHNEHELYLINDSGDFPWNASDQYQWYEWQELIGPNTDVANIDLPKNLIEDLHLNSWREIEKHLLASPSRRYDPGMFPGDIELVRLGFEKQ